MSTKSTSAFVASGGYSAETRKNPAMEFGEKAAKTFDTRDHSTFREWVTDDFSVNGPDGGQNKGDPRAVFDAARQVYDKVFTEYRHVPSSTIVVDTDNGHKVMVHGSMYANLLAVSAVNLAKVTDEAGTKWDIQVPIFAEVDLVKDANAKHNGLLMKHVNFIIDQSQVLQRLQAKGLDPTSWLK